MMEHEQLHKKNIRAVKVGERRMCHFYEVIDKCEGCKKPVKKSTHTCAKYKMVCAHFYNNTNPFGAALYCLLLLKPTYTNI